MNTKLCDKASPMLYVGCESIVNAGIPVTHSDMLQTGVWSIFINLRSFILLSALEFPFRPLKTASFKLSLSLAVCFDLRNKI